jgi:methylase of polypeptide subunit release factors
LGAMATGTHYIGIDPNGETITNNRAMMEALGISTGIEFKDTELIQACAEDCLGRMEPVDLIFTSPPYFDAEKYTDEPTQSYLRYPTLDKWYAGFMDPCIAQAKQALLPGGHLVLNVNEDMAERVKSAALGVGFVLEDTWRLALSQHQYNKKSCGLYRYEPVLVFRKP